MHHLANPARFVRLSAMLLPWCGTWWVWDARLTSVLVLFFLYLGYIVTLR